MNNRPTDYKVVRTSSPERYFQSLSDAADDAEQGLEDTRIVPLYSGTDILTEDKTNDNLIKQIKELELLIKLIKENPERANDITRQENDARCARYGCDNDNQLQWKWRNIETLPAEFDYMECEAAILDAFVRQGGATVWSGDGSGCATQIVEAVWKRMKAAEDKVKELQKPKPEPVGNQEIQKRIGELQDEIMVLSYKILGDPTKSFTMNVNPNGQDLGTTIFNPFSCTGPSIQPNTTKC